MKSIDIVTLKEYLHYDECTGLWTWLKTKGSTKAGTVCSCEQKGYIVIKINKKKYYAQRLAWFYMTEEWPEGEIDHKNNIRNDNRWPNLRLATRQENRHNSLKSSYGENPYKGTCFHKKKWQASIVFNYKKIYIGRYDTPEEAALAYNRKAIELFGTEYANLNKI